MTEGLRGPAHGMLPSGCPAWWFCDDVSSCDCPGRAPPRLTCGAAYKYHLFGIDIGFTINPHLNAKRPYETLRDFAPIALLRDFGVVLRISILADRAPAGEGPLSRPQNWNYTISESQNAYWMDSLTPAKASSSRTAL